MRKRPQWLKALGEEAMAEDAAKYGDPRHLLQRAKEARAEAKEAKAARASKRTLTSRSSGSSTGSEPDHAVLV